MRLDTICCYREMGNNKTYHQEYLTVASSYIKFREFALSLNYNIEKDNALIHRVIDEITNLRLKVVFSKIYLVFYNFSNH